MAKLRAWGALTLNFLVVSTFLALALLPFERWFGAKVSLRDALAPIAWTHCAPASWRTGSAAMRS